ncbi:MAG: GNAT family N-acetyltransferase [Planctomycetaceae bacterium]|nr:GNAT family N-acetyltransferase [Planctomycetaceae bacterium]
MHYNVTLIDTVEKLEDFVPDWLDFLQTEPIGTSLYNNPAYLLANFRHRPEEFPNLTLAVTVVWENRKIVCIAPLAVQDKFFHLEASYKKLFSVRIRLMICFASSFIYAKERANPDDYFDAVFAALKSSGVRFDLLKFFGLRMNSAFCDYCRKRLTGRFFNVLAEKQHDLLIHLPETMEQLLASIDKKKRKNVRNDLKHFHESVKEYRLERITESVQLESFFDTVMKISANSWQGKTLGLTDWKTDSRLRCWKEIADNGLLRSYILWADGKPIAYRLAYQCNGTFYGQESQYNLSVSDLAPGIICLYYVLDDLMTYKPVKTYDFDFGTLGNKRIFANEEIESMIAFMSGSYRGVLLVRLQMFLNRLIFVSKKFLQKLGLADKIRKQMKKKK